MRQLPTIKVILLPLLCALLWACDGDARKSAAEAGPTRLIPKPCWFETDDSWPLAQCFMMEVPEDYAKPEGRKLQFPVVRFVAFEPDPDKAPLLHLGAGGPGAALGLEPENATEWLWVNYAEMTVDDGRDLIVMDPRGTGMARPRLTCDEFIQDAQTAFQRALSRDEEARVFTFSMERCYSRLSDQADLAQYHSANVARDVEALRKQLEVDKLNLYGVSYASRYALTLARDFPQSVRALVLNSAVFPDIKYTQQLAGDSLAAYRRGLAFCSEDKQCNSRYPDLQRRLENLVQTLDENPRTITVKHLYSEEQYPFVLTGQRLLRVLFQALYDENFYPDLPQVIEGLESGNDTPVRAAIANFMNILLDPYFGDAAGVSHFCYEEAPFVDFDKARAQAADSGILGGAVRADLELMQVQCRIWAIPSAPLSESRAIKTPLPVLVLHGALDPVLAVEDADRARQKLPNHQWLLFPNLAHDVISASNCAENAAARFLDNPREEVTKGVAECRREEMAASNSTDGAGQVPEAGAAQGNSEASAAEPNQDPAPAASPASRGALPTQ
ncbi:alpha/beta fold hydrolase [Microbulbifer yueqingensis]|uniref:Pimeloyl-ACP methyl ester carboxylesterase n=1 Tax=Microbulbifer yueqingensis TaxID=658219 RepID=A0A1G8ZG32_9GAMM|nr:alpha/beta hydrolase [Microbulbifer yueqingensis]SDK14069.1 Pimeloyl-ACP methyl ester carboxylesterase [Microbulbifer yueqingensis]